MKKALSTLLSIVIAFTFVCSSITINAEDSVSSNPETPIIDNEYSVKSTNSFGNLLTSKISSEMDKQNENNGYNVFAAEVTDKTVYVEYETTKNCTILSAIYDEEGIQLLASGSTNVLAENTTTEVKIETEKMPEYFYLKVFMIDTVTLKPLCTAYESPNYTKEMQEFFAKTVDDFDSEKVFNLDTDKTNNFAVYGDKVKIVKHSGNSNKVTKAEEENECYVIENADSSVTSLKKDDIFTYKYDSGELLIVKIGEITINGTTVTIIGQDTDMEEVFDYVKIDSTNNNPTGYSIEPDSNDFTSAYIKDKVEYNAPLLEGNYKASDTIKTDLADKKLFGNDDNNVKISGSVTFSITGSIKYYLDLHYAYLELKFEYGAEVEAGISGQLKASIPLGSLGISPCPGVIIELTPSIVFKFNASLTIKGEIKGTVGLSVDSDSGYKDLTKAPNVDFEPPKIEATIYIGFSLEPKIKIISDKVAKASLTAEVGFEAKGTLELFNSSNDTLGYVGEMPDRPSCIHECEKCIVGNINGKITIKAGVTLGNKKAEEYNPNVPSSESGKKKRKWTFEFTPLAMTLPICDFHYSFDYKEFAFTSCPHMTYKTTIQVVDPDGKPVDNAMIGYCDPETFEIKEWGKANIDGKFEKYLPNGLYEVWGIGSKMQGKKTFTIHNNSKSIVIKISDTGLGDYVETPDISNPKETDELGNIINPSTPDDPKDENNNYGYDLSLGYLHTAFKNDDGNLYIWGNNRNGQLGNGTTEISLVPIKIMDNVKQISLSSNNSAAVTKYGSLYIWGWNYFGALGNGTTKDSYVPIKVMDNVKQASVGGSSSAAIKEDGTLYTWGYGNFGKLGNGTTEDSLNPTKIMENVEQICLGTGSSAAIKEDGSLYMWGLNTEGQLGNNTTKNSSLPIKIMDNVKSVSLGGHHSAAITKDGSLYTWGENNRGQLGNGTTENSLIPIKIMDNVKQVSLGTDHSAAITEDGSLYIWGSNENGALGNGEKSGFGITPNPIPIKIMENVKQVSLGDRRSAAITEDGILYTWGINENGALGNGTTEDSLVPIKITIPSEISTQSENLTTDYKFLASEFQKKTHRFNGKSNEIYNFYALKSAHIENMLSSDNLLYTTQTVADKEGNFSVSYMLKEEINEIVIIVKAMSQVDISNAEVTIPDILCNGLELFAKPIVKIEGITLTEGIDYDLEGDYSAIIPGEYNITIVGCNNYTGKISTTYNIYCKHSFSEDKCSICGSLNSIKGDVNGDKATGVADLVALQKYLVKHKLIVNGNPDVNSDGKINVFDAVSLRRMILRYNI